MSTCYRNHLKKDHKEIYESTIWLKNLKHAKDVSASLTLQDTPYTKEKFEFLLCRWIVTDDQVCIWLTCFSIVLLRLLPVHQRSRVSGIPRAHVIFGQWKNRGEGPPSSDQDDKPHSGRVQEGAE